MYRKDKKNNADGQRAGHGKLVFSMLLCVAAMLFLPVQQGIAGELTFSLTAEEEALALEHAGETVLIAAGADCYVKTEQGDEYGAVLPVLEFFQNELGLVTEVVEITGAEKTATGQDRQPDIVFYSTLGLTAESSFGSGLAAIWERFVTETEEGARIPVQIAQQAAAYERWKFKQENEAKITALKQETNQIIWSVVSEEEYPLFYLQNGVQQGSAVRLTGYYSELLELDFVYQPGAEGSERLIGNEIQLLFGYHPKEQPEEANETTTEDGYKWNRFAVRLMKSFETSEYQLVVSADSPVTTAEEIPYVYWGITYADEALGGMEALQNRTIGFASSAELLEALNKGEIDGIVIRKQQYEQLSQQEPEQYRSIGEAVCVAEHPAGNPENVLLNQLIDCMTEAYQAENRLQQEIQEGLELAWKGQKQSTGQNAGAEQKSIVLWFKGCEPVDYLLIGAMGILSILFVICLRHLFPKRDSSRDRRKQ